MKVILLKDVKSQGKKDDVIEVSPGYAANYLFPMGLAKEASSANLNSLKKAKDAEDHRKAMAKQEALDLCDRLKKTALVIALKVSENGKIFGALTSQMIADELLKQNINIDKRQIVLDAPIKTVGRHEILIKPYAEISARIIIEVVPA